jgi:hypothetical protein
VRIGLPIINGLAELSIPLGLYLYHITDLSNDAETIEAVEVANDILKDGHVIFLYRHLSLTDQVTAGLGLVKGYPESDKRGAGLVNGERVLVPAGFYLNSIPFLKTVIDYLNLLEGEEVLSIKSVVRERDRDLLQMEEGVGQVMNTDYMKKALEYLGMESGSVLFVSPRGGRHKKTEADGIETLMGGVAKLVARGHKVMYLQSEEMRFPFSFRGVTLPLRARVRLSKEVGEFWGDPEDRDDMVTVREELRLWFNGQMNRLAEPELWRG